jgi:hypothetical protein
VHGRNEPWRLSIVTQRPAQFTDANRQYDITHVSLRPDRIEQRLFGHELVRMLHEGLQFQPSSCAGEQSSETPARGNCGNHAGGGDARGRWIPIRSGFGGDESGHGRGRREKVLKEEVMEHVVEPENLEAAYRRVKANGGAAGVDGRRVEA